MPIRKPEESDLISFISRSCQLDHIQLSSNEVGLTLKIGRGGQLQEGENPIVNPYAVGHFRVFNFLFGEGDRQGQGLLGTTDFPCKDSQILINEYHSNTVLWWLREIHQIITYPVAKHSANHGDFSYRTNDCGTYRCTGKMLAFGPAPEPEQIQPLLHLWLLDVSKFHDEIKGKVSNPYGLTRTEAEHLYHKPLEAFCFISTILPFENGNNLVGRLVENSLRLQWGLPWKQPEDRIAQLGIYQEKTLPKLLSQIRAR